MPARKVPEPETINLDAEAIHKSLVKNCTCLNTSLKTLAATLGVTDRSLSCLCCVPYSSRAYAFPMRDGDGQIVGLRLRGNDGSKWAVKGSKQGIFIPTTDLSTDQLVVVVEGPTDCAAAISMGYYGLGRPSCSGGAMQIKRFIQCRSVRKVVIVSDLDGPGLRGAKDLAETLRVKAALLVLPAKDIRKFYNSGGTKAVMDSIINQLVWHQY